MVWGCRRVAYPYHYGWCSHGWGFNQKRMQRELGSASRALNKSSTGEDWREERPYTHRRRRYSRATLLPDGAAALWLSVIGVARRRCTSCRRAVYRDRPRIARLQYDRNIGVRAEERRSGKECDNRCILQD